MKPLEWILVQVIMRKLIIIGLKAAVVVLFLAGVAFVTHKATLKYIEFVETIDSLRFEVSRLETIVESDHEQIIVCPHVVDRNRKLSKKVK